MNLFAEVNGVFNTGLSFGEMVIFLIIAIIGVVTIRFSFTFDINKSREAKQESYRQRLINACPHVKNFVDEYGQHGLQSTYISPPGTIVWQCQRCGHQAYQQGDEFNVRVQYYIDHLDEFNAQNKRFKKLLKKAGMI